MPFLGQAILLGLVGFLEANQQKLVGLLGLVGFFEETN